MNTLKLSDEQLTDLFNKLVESLKSKFKILSVADTEVQEFQLKSLLLTNYIRNKAIDNELDIQIDIKLALVKFLISEGIISSADDMKPLIREYLAALQTYQLDKLRGNTYKITLAYNTIILLEVAEEEQRKEQGKLKIKLVKATMRHYKNFEDWSLDIMHGEGDSSLHVSNLLNTSNIVFTDGYSQYMICIVDSLTSIDNPISNCIMHVVKYSQGAGLCIRSMLSEKADETVQLKVVETDMVDGQSVQQSKGLALIATHELLRNCSYSLPTLIDNVNNWRTTYNIFAITDAISTEYDTLMTNITQLNQLSDKVAIVNMLAKINYMLGWMCIGDKRKLLYELVREEDTRDGYGKRIYSAVEFVRDYIIDDINSYKHLSTLSKINRLKIDILGGLIGLLEKTANKLGIHVDTGDNEESAKQDLWSI